MKNPLFSIIVPTYGRPELLDEAIKSVTAQTIDDFECIVVDDASPEPLGSFEDPRVRVVRRSVNGGPAAARNTGIENARGQHVAFLDSDDLYTKNRLEFALEGLARAPIAVCWSRYLDEPKGRTRVLEGDVRDTIMDSTIPHLGATAVSTEFVDRFDESYVAGQDVEWWLRIAQVARVATVPQVGCLIRRHPGIRHGNDQVTRVRSGFRLLQAHSAYFGEHPRAAAFRWKRIGLMAAALGDHKLARTALLRSLRLRPEVPTIWHFARSIRASSERVNGTFQISDNGTP